MRIGCKPNQSVVYLAMDAYASKQRWNQNTHPYQTTRCAHNPTVHPPSADQARPGTGMLQPPPPPNFRPEKQARGRAGRQKQGQQQAKQTQKKEVWAARRAARLPFDEHMRQGTLLRTRVGWLMDGTGRFAICGQTDGRRPSPKARPRPGSAFLPARLSVCLSVCLPSIVDPLPFSPFVALQKGVGLGEKKDETKRAVPFLPGKGRKGNKTVLVLAQAGRQLKPNPRLGSLPSHHPPPFFPPSIFHFPFSLCRLRGQKHGICRVSQPHTHARGDTDTPRLVPGSWEEPEGWGRRGGGSRAGLVLASAERCSAYCADDRALQGELWSLMLGG